MSTTSGVTKISVTTISEGADLKTRPKYVLKRPKSKIPKPRVKPKPRYFTSGENISDNNQRDFEKEPSPFSYPKDLEAFAFKVMTKAWRKDVKEKEFKKKAIDRSNYRTRQSKDLLNRLYVKDPEIKNMKTVLDLNSDYFKLVEGRPIKEKFELVKYRETIRDILKTKVITGYREDDIMLIEENIATEQRMIDKIKEKYQEYVNIFEEFLYKDHTMSMSLLHEADQASKLANFRYEQYKQMAKEYSGLRSVLYSLEEKWRNCQMYQKFLYLISPVSWRREHDPNMDKTREFITLEAIREIYSQYSEQEDQSLDQLMQKFIQECSSQNEPKLYFTEPKELMDLFLFMELQNLNSLLHSEELAEPIEVVKFSMERVKETFDQEIIALQNSIGRLEGGILWEEERAKFLEDLAHELINGEFKKLLVDDDVLNLKVFVEDVYESRIGVNDANLSMGEMMKAIENKYRYELLQLDQLPTEQVTKLEGNAYMEELRILKLAEDAKKQYLSLERLQHSMEKAFAPPFVKEGRQMKNRSHPINPPKPVPPKPRMLTQAENDYLHFFTEYCEETDDIKDYGINPEVEKDNTEEETGKQNS